MLCSRGALFEGVARQDEARTERSRAMGAATTPILKNDHALTDCFSRRRTISQRIVASDPVTERLGPRSTPMSSAFRNVSGTWVWLSAAPVRRPEGRLLMTFERKVTPKAPARSPCQDGRGE